MTLKPFLRISLFTVTKPIRSLFSFSTQRYSPFSTSIASNHPRFSHSFDDAVPGSSAVYRHALKFQRPATVQWSKKLDNRASFIGTVTLQPKVLNSKKTDKYGVYTVLKVSRPNAPNSSCFKVPLVMWDCVAKIASKHLKPNDFIYVSGCLGSYETVDASGNTLLRYQLHVKELDFVAQYQGQGHNKVESTEGEPSIQNDQNRLYLWQVFFSNPYEWWDDRKRKLNPNQPDFKHKDTGEALWLSKYDPPWVRKQLQVLDSKMAEGGFVGRRRVTTWVYDE